MSYLDRRLTVEYIESLSKLGMNCGGDIENPIVGSEPDAIHDLRNDLANLSGCVMVGILTNDEALEIANYYDSKTYGYVSIFVRKVKTAITTTKFNSLRTRFKK